MIAFLVGTIEEKYENYLVMDVNGVGYELLISNNTLVALPNVNETTKVLTYLHVKEDGVALYGFATAEEKQISVKTVEAYMTRALKFLRIELKDYLPILLILYPHWLG